MDRVKAEKQDVCERERVEIEVVNLQNCLVQPLAITADSTER